MDQATLVLLQYQEPVVRPLLIPEALAQAFQQPGVVEALDPVGVAQVMVVALP